VYGAGAVALIVVPLKVTAAPSPFGQAAGEGNVPKLCAVEQLSLAGCANAIALNSINDIRIENLNVSSLNGSRK